MKTIKTKNQKGGYHAVRTMRLELLVSLAMFGVAVQFNYLITLLIGLVLFWLTVSNYQNLEDKGLRLIRLFGRAVYSFQKVSQWSGNLVVYAYRQSYKSARFSLPARNVFKKPITQNN